MTGTRNLVSSTNSGVVKIPVNRNKVHGIVYDTSNDLTPATTKIKGRILGLSKSAFLVAVKGYIAEMSRDDILPGLERSTTLFIEHDFYITSATHDLHGRPIVKVSMRPPNKRVGNDSRTNEEAFQRMMFNTPGTGLPYEKIKVEHSAKSETDAETHTNKLLDLLVGLKTNKK
jgi:hypothetical protein